MPGDSRQLISRYVTAGGFRTHVRVAEHAAGPPLVLVHGLVISSLYMVPTARCLAPHLPVYAPDLPGFGLSEKPRRVLTVPEHAAWLAEWMDVIGLPRAVLIGNSFGCQVIAHLAADHPVAGGLDNGAPSLAPAHLRDYWKAGIPRALRTFRLALEDRVEPKLQARYAGGAGRARPHRSPARAREAAALLPRGRYAEVPGGPHCINYTTRDRFVRLVRTVLAGHGAL